MFNIKKKITEHLLRLSPEDRYCRFGTAVNDEFIRKYVDKLDPSDSLFFSFGIDGSIVAFCHLAQYSNDSADLGLSVDASHRNKGLGRLLTRQAISEAKVKGFKKLYIYFLSDNAAMYKLAHRHGLSVMPYADQHRGELEIGEPTIFDFYGNLLTNSIVLMDNTFKQIFARDEL